ncbi:SDR family NAD(P)-dependent oxidoreductase [Pseudomonadota bacterium]
MNFDFGSKVILVTGGSRGIGRELCRMFAEAGGRVVFNYRDNTEAADAVLSELQGSDHMAVQADLADPDAVERLVGEVVDQTGSIDVLVNNAGIYELHEFAGVSYPDWRSAWRHTIDVNLVAPANLAYCAGRHMMQKGGGRIVNIGSRGAFRGEPKAPAYAAAKAGLHAMSQSLAQTLAPYRIFVGAVAPGFVRTDMAETILSGPEGDGIRAQSPLNRVAEPEEVARAALFLASEGCEFLTGSIIDVNGASYLRS